MKFDVSYSVYTTNALVWYTEDKELNFNGAPIEADTESEALIRFKEMVHR